MSVRLLCEGNWDARVDRRGQCEGAAVVILQRLIGGKHTIRAGRLPKLTKGGGLRKKLKLAISEADLDPECHALVVIVDRDKPEYNDRLQAMEAGVEEMAGKAITARTVAGMAIEELEAWLIASSKPLGDSFRSISGVSQPEAQRNPKKLFHEMLDQARVPYAEGYDLAAHQMNFAEVEAKCKAFMRFSRAVQERVK